jgi:membrane-associated phospholipid phosphatase
MIKKSLILLTFVIHCITGQAQVNDSTDFSGSKKTSLIKSFIPPAVIIGIGVATIGDKRYFSSQDTYNFMQRRFNGFHTKADDVTFILPAIGVYGLNFIGIKGKNNFFDRSAMFFLSGTLANAVSYSFKTNYDYLRPDGSEFNSFPSGHTTNAFVCAEFLHQEYGHLSPWYSVAGYSLAAATGAMRLMNNRHWMSDVLVGAGLGMISVKSVYWLYPKIKERIFKNKKEDYAMIVPYYTRSQAGISAVWIFK